MIDSAYGFDLVDLLVAYALWTAVGAAGTAGLFAVKKRSIIAGALVGAVAGFFGSMILGAIPVLLVLWLGLWFLLPRLGVSRPAVADPIEAQFAPLAGPPVQPAYRPPTAAEPQRQNVPGKNSIFVSYRRDDSAELTGRIYDRLVQQFGKEAVFKDVDSIPYGVDFRKHLKDVVGKCGALISVIGDKWLTCSDEAGNRRLDDPGDYVRIEIEAALERDVPVVPLLIRGTKMPKESELPADLKDLAYRNGTVVRNDPDFHPDMDRLIKSLEQQLR